MKKPEKQRKESDDSVFSKNHSHAIKYRKRVQEDKEKQEEVEEFLKGKEDGTSPGMR